MKVFIHHIYEYQKGLRNLILHTAPAKDRQGIINRLETNRIPYLISDVSKTKINVFFGNKVCIDVIKKLKHKNLSELTDEEDFILGIMLGYEVKKQCYRYLKRKKDGIGENLIG